jgi:hypothetical protein
MAAITKKETRLKLQFVANTDHSIHAGLVAVEAMARRFGLCVPDNCLAFPLRGNPRGRPIAVTRCAE